MVKNDRVKGNILVRRDGRAGCLTLNRPDALNALTADMLIDAEAALDRWRTDPSVDLVMIDAAGSKAFCAGGDIAELYAKGCAGHHQFGRDFWRQEYRLNFKIATYSKPIVVFMQGFTLGGGVGIACHASHRIVGESSQIGMPECAIGLIPDVGGTHILARAPGAVGTYLGLTGRRIDAQDAIYATFADMFVPEKNWYQLKQDLALTGSLEAVSAGQSMAQGGVLARHRTDIDAAFAKDNLFEIAQALTAQNTDFAKGASRLLAKGSPLAQACGLYAIRAARHGELHHALRREYRFVARATEHGDFLEGIRAQLIDRDFAPKWLHDSKNVPQDDVDKMMASLGSDDWDETGDIS